MVLEAAVTFWQTFATTGLLTGVIGGIIAIDFATKKKYMQIIKDIKELSADMHSGLISEK